MADTGLILTSYILGKTSQIDKSQIRLRTLILDYLKNIYSIYLFIIY